MVIGSYSAVAILVICTAVGCSSSDGGAPGGEDAGVAGNSSGGAAATGGNTAGTGGGGASRGTAGRASGAGGTVPSSSGGEANGTGAAGGAGGRSSSSTGGAAGGAGKAVDGGGDGSPGLTPSKLFFSPYKDTSINMNWNTNVVATNVSGSAAPLASALVGAGTNAVTLAFATGECGSENWAGLSGSTMAATNVPLLTKANIRYVVSTGGAAGVFTCGSDAGFTSFVDRWASANLVGIDFDIEAGQSESQVGELVRRIKSAHAAYPALRFSLTLATLANNDGAATAESLGSAVRDSFNTYGDQSMAAVSSTLGFSGNAASWPPYLTVNLMTMDYGAPGSGVCVVSGGACQMGQSAVQAAYNLHDEWGVPYDHVELTPMIGGNDVSTEKFTLADGDTVARFAISQGLAGVHYWSLDRDTDCAVGAASPTCNSMGAGYAGPLGYLERFSNGLR